jgi:hypothetical protein
MQAQIIGEIENVEERWLTFILHEMQARQTNHVVWTRKDMH